MATRSTISVVHKDGKVSSAYCHWDGYISHNGNILKEHYNTLELVEKLVSFGSMSVLAPLIEPTGEHSFDNPEKDVTVYYGRDRGEDYTEPTEFNSLGEFFDDGVWEEYNYLFNDGEWVCSTRGEWLPF